jgi:hypothetical protein
MKFLPYLLPILLLAACAETKSQRTDTIDGNKLQVTYGTITTGRFIMVENVDRRWEGKLKGGREKWLERKDLLDITAQEEMEKICDNWPYVLDRKPFYNMMDKDETMGGAAPMLGMSVAFMAYVAAASATDEANVPVSIYAYFHCRNDEFRK